MSEKPLSRFTILVLIGAGICVLSGIAMLVWAVHLNDELILLGLQPVIILLGLGSTVLAPVLVLRYGHRVLREHYETTEERQARIAAAQAARAASKSEWKAIGANFRMCCGYSDPRSVFMDSGDCRSLVVGASAFLND
jgi:hypothetical protein